MRIRSIRLQNVKSYSDCQIEFADGTNAICGRNGSGKSTILEAIGFVLFDYLQTPQADFVRKGEKTAIATVEVEKNGRLFSIQRSCGGTSRYAVFGDDLQVADGKAETVAWIHTLLSIPDNEDLNTIFRDAVGVPQGMLTTAFMDTPANRKRTFGPLLHVDDYELAWTKLREAEKVLDSKVNTLNLTIAGLEAEIRPLQGAEEGLAEAKRLFTECNEELFGVDDDISGSIRLISDMDRQEGAVTGSKDVVNRLKERLAALDSVVYAHKLAVDTAEASAKIVKDALLGHESYLATAKSLEDVTEEFNLASAAKLVAEAVSANLARLHEQASDIEKSIAHADDLFAQAEGLYALSDCQGVLQAKLESLYVQDRERNVLEDREKAASLALAAAEKGTKSAREFLSEIPTLQDALDEYNASLKVDEAQKEALTSKGLEIKGKMEALEARITALSEDVSACPICGEPLSQHHKDQLVLEANGDLKILGDVRHVAVAAWRNVSKNVDDLKSKIDSATRKLGALTGTPSIDTFTERETECRAELERIHTSLLEYAFVADGIHTCNDELKGIGNPSADLSACLAVANTKPALVVQLESVRRAIAEGEYAVEGNLRTASFLDETTASVAKFKTLLADLLPYHELYLAHKETAGKLTDAKDKLDAANEDLSVASEEHSKACSVLEGIESKYDSAAHAEAKAKLAALMTKKAVLEERIGAANRNINGYEREVAGLKRKVIELDNVNLNVALYAQQKKHLQFLRQAIRDAGPEITKMIAASISITADRLFCDIVQDPSARLEWTEDYDIVVTMDGQERHFNQLSGGEQMSAALSVRLALLREISDIDFAFFDEPTVNLDEQRRESLAGQIMNIQGFSQLFVISHDDSFEQGTNNAVRITKEDGVSSVAQ